MTSQTEAEFEQLLSLLSDAQIGRAFSAPDNGAKRALLREFVSTRFFQLEEEAALVQ